jgi:hypothetical protein
MDRLLARRIEREKKFREDITKVAKDYLRLGRGAVEYWTGDFDVAYDALMCYAPLTRDDYVKLAKGHPRRYVLPMSATQITTMATYIAQVLFGQDTPHKVEPRGPEDEIPAEHVNRLLKWNAERQPFYTLGYLWVQDCLVANRGIFYNSWAPLYGSEVVQESVMDPEEVDPETGVPSTYFRPVRKTKVIGGYNRAELVSPYDWVADPALPLWRLNDMRFCGHKTRIAYHDLERRSKLPIDHPSYVLPSAVAELKEKKAAAKTPSIEAMVSGSGSPTSSTSEVSRTEYERTRSTSDLGLPETGNQKDPGIFDVWELWVKLVPVDHEIHDGEESSVFQFLIAGEDVLLAVNESTYAHGVFPYSVAEGRPFAHYQFSPSWITLLKGLQDHVDYLKNRHQEAIARTVGNVFIANPEYVEIEDFLDPEKEGMLIVLKPNATGMKISEAIQQVPIKDLTENFQEEMMQFLMFSESVTGANSSMQGSMSSDADSATQFAGTQQMSAGRMSSVARLLSTQALVGQTQQFVSNFQQFLDVPQILRFQPNLDTPAALQGVASLAISRDTIQGSFDFVAHDGTLPGTDGKKVAAITRILETVGAFPQIFAPAPGNLDPRKLVFGAAKASGIDLDNFQYPAASLPAPYQPGGAAGPPVAPAGPPGMPSPAGPGQPPGPAPENPAAPALPQIKLPALGPSQPRPGGLGL